MSRQLTLEESVADTLALKGETTAHRRWPKEVVESFLAAEVIAEERRAPVRQVAPGAGVVAKILLITAVVFLARRIQKITSRPSRVADPANSGTRSNS